MSLLTAFKKEWLEQRRSRKFLIAVIVLTFFGMTSPLLAKFMPQMLALIPGASSIASLVPEPTVQDAVAQYIKNITQFGVLMALLFAMGSVASEKEKGTAALVLTKPLPRSSFLLAKFLALALTFTVALALAGVSAYYYTAVLFGAPDGLNWFLLNALLLLYMLVYVAVTLLFSTLVKTQYIAMGASFGVLILLGILGAIPGWSASLPDGLIQNGAALLTGAPLAGWQCLWVSLGILILSLGAAILAFRKQEL